MWIVRVASAGALSIVAGALVLVGWFEDDWPARTTVWATALAAGALGAQWLASAWSDRPDGWRSQAGPVVDRLVTSHTWLVAVCLVLPFVATASVPRDGLLPAAGDLSLLLGAEGRVSLVVPLEDGGITVCARTGESWSSDWSSLGIAPNWGNLGRGSAFFSGRGSFQLLGQRRGTLVDGRWEKLRWYGHYVVTMDSDDQPVTSARGRPAFFPRLGSDSTIWYIALVPDRAGGVRLYWRIGNDWHRGALVERWVGLVESVAVVDVPDDGIKAVVRVDDRLLWLTRPAETGTDALAEGWTEAEEVRTAAGEPVEVVGDPALVETTVTGSSDERHYKIAVETVDGLRMLTVDDFESNSWAVEPLPAPGPTASVALIGTSVDERPSLLVVYRIGDIVYATSRAQGGTWRPPEPLRCIH